MDGQSFEGALLNKILRLLDQQSDALVRVGLQSLIGWTLAVALVGGGAIWGMRRAGWLGQTPRAKRICSWVMGLVVGLVCWPLVTLPATTKAVAHKVRDIVAADSDALGLTIPVGQAVMSPLIRRMWDQGLIEPPEATLGYQVQQNAARRDYQAEQTSARYWIEASAWIEAEILLNPAIQEALLSSLTAESIWAQGEHVRAAVLASKHPLPDWMMRDIIEHGHGLLTQDMSMYRDITKQLKAEPVASPAYGSSTEMVHIRLSLQAVARQAGELFFRDYTRPLVEAFMARFVVLGLWVAGVAFAVSALLCFALTRTRSSDWGAAVPPELDS